MIVNFLRLRKCQTSHLTNKGEENKIDAPTDSLNEDLGELLMGILCFYGKDFDFFWNVISLRHNGPVPKKDNPEWWATPWIPVIEDPLFPENNVSRTTYKMCEIKQTFYEAYLTLRLLSDRNSDSQTDSVPILPSILFISSELVNYRQHMSSLYPAKSPKHVKYHNFRTVKHKIPMTGL